VTLVTAHFLPSPRAEMDDSVEICGVGKSVNPSELSF